MLLKGRGGGMLTKKPQGVEEKLVVGGTSKGWAEDLETQEVGKGLTNIKYL